MKASHLLPIALIALAPFAAHAADEWRMVSDSGGLKVSTRDVAGSVPEMRVEGRIDAPPERVLAVLADVDAYSETMPHTEESRMVKREGNTIWMYSVVDPPLASRRDYCVKITLSEKGDGILATTWIPDNEVAPPQKSGTVRVKVNDGGWTLVPADDGRATYAVYRLHVDPGGNLPKWIVNKANRTSVPDAFKAVRKAATSKRYENALNPMNAG
ncbi:START domain-containing protein [Vulgatibacter incomptus]|uniref:Collagenase n=1 Tax=Vulgatibacter incomptus TaxID=1391653 RepID=A0A0K1PBF1_9BACT|nr:START domain-containing protein [Vulgatibacter incomptus]AKU90454.1 Collagenase [Vulgatibacter incomptus]